ncbi:MAG: helix-turn-helix transcriptional regulator [Planctomycetota bacterium]
MPNDRDLLQEAWSGWRRRGGLQRLAVIHQPDAFPVGAAVPRAATPTPFLYLQIPRNRSLTVWFHQQGRVQCWRIPPRQAVCWTPGSWCCTSPDGRSSYLRLTVQADGLLVGMRRLHPRSGAGMLYQLLQGGDPGLIAALQRHLIGTGPLLLAADDSRLHAANCLAMLVARDLDAPRAPRSAADHLALALGYIGDHCHQDIGRDQVAAAVGISPTHCSRLFAAHRGHGVQAEISQQRMQLAARLLNHPDIPVARVARAVGIADPSQFSRSFRRVHGCTPRQWSRRAAGPADD